MTVAWALRQIHREARQRPGALLALGGAIAVLVLVGGAAALGGRLSMSIAGALEQNVHVIAYLGGDGNDVERTRLLEVLGKLPGVAEVRSVEPDEALARLQAVTGTLGQARSALSVEAGFLPRSIEIALRPGPQAAARAAELAARLRGVAGVTEVDAMTDGLERLHSWMTLGRWLARTALALSAAGALALVAWSLGRDRAGRRQRAQVLHLLGETPSGMRLPGGLGAGAGALAGAAMALALLAAAFPHAVAALEEKAGLSLGGPVFFAPTEIALALVAAALVGAVLGWLASPVPRGEHA